MPRRIMGYMDPSGLVKVSLMADMLRLKGLS